MFALSLIITLLCIFIDQIIKIIVMNSMSVGSSNNIIDNFFSITYVENDGAAWSILSGNRIFLILISVVALVLIYIYIFKNKNMNKLEFISYSVLIGGIVGNLVDRIRFGKVIDYLDFDIFGYNYPVFNFADICIVVSIIILLIYSIKDGIKNAKDKN